MTLQHSIQNDSPQGLSKVFLYSKKLAKGVSVIGQGFYLVYRHRLYKNPNDPNNTRYVQWFCRELCQVFNIEVQVHGDISHAPALWVSNHISWLDVAVLGSGARVFFLAKAEIQSWPIFGKLAKGGGTLFIRRGSGDSNTIRNQITQFLSSNIPVLFFPEATTTDGSYVKKVHGRLLGAAIEANRPVQICLICYVNHDGALDMVAPFIGDATFVDHVQQVLVMPKVTAHLMTLEPIMVTGHTVESLTAEVQSQMQAGLIRLHTLALKSSTLKTSSPAPQHIEPTSS